MGRGGGSSRRQRGPPSSTAAVGMETSDPQASAQPSRVSSRDQLAGLSVSSQGHFDSLDLAELAKKQQWWHKLFGQESGPATERYSMAAQLIIGGVTGWCTGFIFQKVGKLAATAVGGGFLLLQLANHAEYIKIDWQQVEKDMKKAKEQLKGQRSTQFPMEVKSKAEEIVLFVKTNIMLAGGFLGGFLFGMYS